MNYAKYHFAMEEDMMLHNNYKYMAEHVKEHELFTDRVMFIVFNADDDENRPKAVSDFLRKWLIEHIATVDKLMGECLMV